MAFCYNEAQKELKDFIMESARGNFDTAVTLTFKYRVNHDLRMEIFRTYLNKLNKKVYGSRCWQSKFKYNLRKGIKIIPIHEYRFGKEPHFHLALKRPSHIDKKEFQTHVKQCWVGLDDKWDMNITSDKFNVIKDIYDEEGWICYITKQIDFKNTDGLLIEHLNF